MSLTIGSELRCYLPDLFRRLVTPNVGWIVRESPKSCPKNSGLGIVAIKFTQITLRWHLSQPKKGGRFVWDCIFPIRQAWLPKEFEWVNFTQCEFDLGKLAENKKDWPIFFQNEIQFFSLAIYLPSDPMLKIWWSLENLMHSLPSPEMYPFPPQPFGKGVMRRRFGAIVSNVAWRFWGVGKNDRWLSRSEFFLPFLLEISQKWIDDVGLKFLEVLLDTDASRSFKLEF